MRRPKALLRAPDPAFNETFLDRLVRLFAPHCSPVIVVLGHDAETIRAGAVRHADALFVVNERHADGQLSSLQCGLRAVPAQAEGVLFTPVDYPAIQPETVEALCGAFRREAGRARLVIPRCNRRHGHPVCCAAELIREFLSLPATAQARDVIHRHAAETCYVDVDDPGILRDIDDPEAYRKLAESAETR